MLLLILFSYFLSLIVFKWSYVYNFQHQNTYNTNSINSTKFHSSNKQYENIHAHILSTYHTTNYTTDRNDEDTKGTTTESRFLTKQLGLKSILFLPNSMFFLEMETEYEPTW